MEAERKLMFSKNPGHPNRPKARARGQGSVKSVGVLARDADNQLTHTQDRGLQVCEHVYTTRHGSNFPHAFTSPRL